jgi:hypothetical protein
MVSRFLTLALVATLLGVATSRVEAQLGQQFGVNTVKTTTVTPGGNFDPREGDFCGMASLSCAAVEIGGNPTGGSTGTDTVINVDLMTGGADATILGIGWQVGVDSAAPSWRSEATVDFAGAVTLIPGLGDDSPGASTYSSSGIQDLSMIDLDGDGVLVDLSFVASGGMMSLTLFESFDDSGLSPDGMYMSDSTITIEYFVPVTCDFDADGDCDADDIDMLVGVGPIAGGVSAAGNEVYDLNTDGTIDLDDRDLWLASAATENGLGSPYKLGDATLDGTVDGNDFLAWNASKFSNTLNWSDGNFNGDSVVDGNDFLAWNANKFSSSDVAAVPEPTSLMVLFLGLCGVATLRR